jgi:hypothetical protein
MAAAIAPVVMTQMVADFDATLGGVIALGGNQIQELNNEGIDMISHLTVIDKDILLGIFPDTDPNLKLTAMKKIRLRAFRQWAVDQKEELASNTDHIDVLLFDDNTCTKFQARLAKKGKSDKESTASKAPTVTLPASDGSPKKWMTKKRNISSLHWAAEGE